MLEHMWLCRDCKAAVLCSMPCCPGTATPWHGFLTAKASFLQELKLLGRKEMACD